MKITKVAAYNFGSYKELFFNYSTEGLHLVYGPTGAGKSTLMDIPCWALFGVTAKNVPVDDVRNWSNLDKPTKVLIILEYRGSRLEIVRIRGKREENDLFWVESTSDDPKPIRGKDITETQKLLETRLDIDIDTYCAASYYSEFSPSASFFTAKASDRRTLMESIVTLDLPVLLKIRLSQKAKDIKSKLNTIEIQDFKLTTKLESIDSQLKEYVIQRESWLRDRDKRIQEYLLLSTQYEQNTEVSKLKTLNAKNHFETQRQETLYVLTQEIEHLSACLEQTQCKVCGRGKSEKDKAKLSNLKLLYNKESGKTNPHIGELETLARSANNFEQLATEEKKNDKDPFTIPINTLNIRRLSLAEELTVVVDKQKELLESSSCIEQLTEVTATLRIKLLENTVLSIQRTANDYMTRFFDGEFTINLKLEGEDKVNVEIFKNEHSCHFQQLSKGQRGLLKLVFSLAVMREVHNKSGHRFETVFLDEPVDGLDPELKVKAHNLFVELQTQHPTVFMIDHSLELKALFDNKLEVALENEHSEIKSG